MRFLSLIYRNGDRLHENSIPLLKHTMNEDGRWIVVPFREYNPADLREVMAVNRTRLLGIIAAVQTIIARKDTA